MKRTILIGLLLIAIPALLAACAAVAPQAEAAPQDEPTAQAESTSSRDVATESPTSPPAAEESFWVEGQPAQDEQGQITVMITPLNLNNPGETLDFEVALNTHSVDLSMDLAAMATLSTDTGLSLPASLWEAPPGGGHHVTGTLKFPALQNGQPVLQGVRQITITIVELDVPERILEWKK